MIDRELAEMLVCPKDRLPLKLADQPLLSRVNRAIAAGRLKNQAGRPVEDPLARRWFGAITRCCIPSSTIFPCC